MRPLFAIIYNAEYFRGLDRPGRWQWICECGERVGLAADLALSLFVVRADVHAAFNRRIGSEVLLHGTQATVLDRSAPLDDAGDRSGPTLGRLLEGVPYERARCLRGIPLLGQFPGAGAHRSSLDRHLRKAAKRLRDFPTRSLNNFSPGNRALRYRRVVALIGIAPIPNRRSRRTCIRGVIIAIVIAAVIGSRCKRSPE
jgi:hypothetical protein